VLITLPPQHIDSIRRHAAADYPRECCGLLLGTLDAAGHKAVASVLPMINEREPAARHNRFLISPLEMLRGEKYARAQHQAIIGIYHSHPDHPAEPSQFDVLHAWPVYSYIIIAVPAGCPGELRSWELAADGAHFNAENLVQGD